MRRYQVIAILVVSNLIHTLVICRRINVQESDKEEFKHEYLSKLFGAISRAKENIQYNRRNDDPMKYLYNTLSDTINVEQFKKWLRHEATAQNEGTPGDDELAGLVEKELLNALSKKSSFVLDKPYVQRKGRNDFLVIRSDRTDPFVTVVPNDIYYNVEKKCVNWLDDCNQKGLRDRLLQKLYGPYK